MTTTCTMILGDCLEVMPKIKKSSVDMCFADIPYAPRTTHFTRNKWDRYFPVDEWWPMAWEVMAHRAQLLMTANARLLSALMGSFSDFFRYDMVYLKKNATGFLDANRRPLRSHEMIALFSRSTGVYNAQKTSSFAYAANRKGIAPNYDKAARISGFYGPERYPRSYIGPLSRDSKTSHPTQKPVALLDWLIRTYSNEGDMVLDPTSGSGTTAVSACQNGRSVVCVEKDEGYFQASVERVRKHVRDNLLDVKIEVRR